MSGSDLQTWLSRSHVALSVGQRTSLAYYVDLGYRAINADLRALAIESGRAVSASTRRHITLLDTAISIQQDFPCAAVLWRGISSQAQVERFRHAGVGTFFVEPAFSSASCSQRVGRFFARDGILLKIVVPAGISGLYVPATGVKIEEQEVIFSREVGYEIRRIVDNEIEVVVQ